MARVSLAPFISKRLKKDPLDGLLGPRDKKEREGILRPQDAATRRPSVGNPNPPPPPPPPDPFEELLGPIRRGVENTPAATSSGTKSGGGSGGGSTTTSTTTSIGSTPVAMKGGGRRRLFSIRG